MAYEKTGVYPVFDIVFKINNLSIAEMETFSLSIDGNVEEWTPMDTKGWMRRLMTGKSFSISLNGKRNTKDEGNNFIAGLSWKTGRDCSYPAVIEFPSGDKLEFDAVINVTACEGGDSTNVSVLEFELMSDGKPTFTPAASSETTSGNSGGN